MTVSPKVPRDAFVVLRTDGSQETVAFPAKRGGARLAAIKQALGFDTLEFLTLTRRGRQAHLVMAVNDQGYTTRVIQHRLGHIEAVVPVRARFPVNPKATELYHLSFASLPAQERRLAHDGRHQIVGDVAIMYDDD